MREDALNTPRRWDKVTLFRPPSEAEAKIAGRKPKHLMQQHGPAVITKELSSNHTTSRLRYKGRTYERNVFNMTPYTSSGTPKIFELTLDTTITQGSFVAMLDDDEDAQERDHGIGIGIGI